MHDQVPIFVAFEVILESGWHCELHLCAHRVARDREQVGICLQLHAQGSLKHLNVHWTEIRVNKIDRASLNPSEVQAEMRLINGPDGLCHHNARQVNEVLSNVNLKEKLV